MYVLYCSGSLYSDEYWWYAFPAVARMQMSPPPPPIQRGNSEPPNSLKPVHGRVGRLDDMLLLIEPSLFLVLMY